MKQLFVVVDMQNDFIDGSLGTPEAKRILSGVKEAVYLALSANDAVAFTKDTHSMDYLATQEGKNLPVAHCIKGTEGWELSPCLLPFVCELTPVFEKPSFGSLELAQYAQREGFDKITLAGLCTDICVISNALLLKAHLPEAEICVNSSLCAGVTVKSHENAIESMKMCQITII